jgi:5-methylcytosine-specific restriction endonuclease McrA
MSNRQAYQEYLQSVHWEHLRQNCLGRSGWKCESCHSTRHLHVHHLNYRNLTDCTVADVMSLCENCHNAWHDQYGSHHVATRLEVLTYLKGIPVYHPRFNGPVHPVQKASTQRQ